MNTVYFEKGSNFANVHNLYQWDYGQSLEIKGLDIHGDVWVQFSMNASGGNAIPVVTEVNDGVITANIPAFVFEKETIQNYNAYAFVYVSNADSGETVKVIKLYVKARPKPEDYVYTEPEKKRYELLEERIKEIEENGVSDGDVVVDDALSETSANPIQNKVVTEEFIRLSEEKVDKTQLTNAVNTALAEAKESGQFDGADGKDGEDGQDGKSVTVSSVSESTADGGSNVVTFSDGKTLTVKNGSKGSDGKNGSDGEDGTDGFSPIATVTPTATGATISITDKNGTTTATITNGKDGKDGQDGKDGYTPQKGVDYFDGKNGEDGSDGKDGSDYVLTDADKEEIAKTVEENVSVNIPTKTSDLNNDSGFITKAVTDLANYYKKSETYTQDEVKALISAIPKFSIQPVPSLPTTDISTTTVYLLKSGEETDNLYTEYIYVNGAWEYLGKQTVDLTGYVKRTELSNYYTIEAIDELINTLYGQIPTKVSQLENDSKFVTSDVTDKLSEDKADQTNFDSHVNNTNIHVTSAEKQVWNNKVDASQLPTITQEAGESESLVMSQKAVTQLVKDTLGEQETTEYETVDSVDEMTDKTKQYVLSTTGTIWTYTETQRYVENNEHNPETAKFNYRINSGGSEVVLNGCLLSDYIPVEYVNPYIVTIDGIEKLIATYNSLFSIDFFDESKTRLGALTSGNFGYSDYGTNGDEYLLPMTFDLFKNTTGTKYTEAKFVRIRLSIKNGVAISSTDCEGLIINLEPKNGYKTVVTWVDSGLTPSQGNDGGNYVSLLVKVNQNTSDINDVNVRVTKLETGNESLTIPSFWEESVNDCIAKIKALQVGRKCITFPFFSDNHQRNGYVGRLIAYVMKECNIPYCFFGGDSISNGYIDSESTMIEQDKAFDNVMSYIPNGRFCRTVGNHDGYWNVSADSGDENYYTREQVYELFLREESIAQNKHFGDDGTYYYIDDIASKTRFIVLNTNKKMVDNVAVGNSVDDEQLTWLQNKALSFNESGWAVVFISHQPISNHYHALISNAEEVRTIVKNYINGTDVNKSDVVGWYSGHIHRDRIYTGIATNTSDDTEGDAMGFTQVTITSDHTGIAYDDATKHTVAEDNQSHAIDFVTINKSTRTVNITRLGIGNDRSYTY